LPDRAWQCRHEKLHASVKGECGDCANRYICGGCRGKAYAATGDPLGEDPTCYIHHTEKPEYLKWMNASD